MNNYLLIKEEEIKLFPSARFLSKEEQKIYEEAIKEFSGKAYDSLNIPREGSNLFKILFLNQIGIRTATFPELELALANGMDLSETYEDTPVVILNSNGDTYEFNDYLAKSLANKLKLNRFENPYVIKGLKVKQGDSPYGLEFITEDAEVIEAKDFNYKNNRRRCSRVNEDYSIEWDDNSNRIFYTRNSGLSGLLYLDCDSYVDGGWHGRFD